MPAVALIAAVGTVSAGAALGGVLGGVMIAGGVMSGIGAVTGNKKLSMLGAVVGLGAGLGAAFGLADSANAAWNSATAGNDALQVTGKSFMADGGVFGAAASPANMNTSGLTSGVQTFGQPMPGVNGVNAGTSLDPSSFGLAPPPGLESATSGGQFMMGAQPPGLVDSATGMATYGSMNVMGPQMPGLSGIGVPGVVAPGSNASGAGTSNRMVDTPPPNTKDASTGFFGKAKDFMKDNPEVVKAGSGLLAGGLQSYTLQSNQAKQMEAMAAARQAYNDSILNQRTTRRA